MKFLIDECLSPELAKIAIDKEHGETSHIVWLGLGGYKDWELTPIILDGDWIFVTKNSVDFRGPRDKPGTKGQYADPDLVNQVLEITLDDDDDLRVLRYALPAEES